MVQPRDVLGNQADHHGPVALQRGLPETASLSTPSLDGKTHGMTHDRPIYDND